MQIFIKNVDLHIISDKEPNYLYFVQFFPNDTNDRFKVYKWNVNECADNTDEWSKRMILEDLVEFVVSLGFSKDLVIKNIELLISEVIKQANKEYFNLKLKYYV